MNLPILTTFLAAVIAGGVSLAVTTLTNKSARKRDREADWRKLKLEQYKEYVFAMSGIVHNHESEVAQRRYSDAFNTLGLVAPIPLMKALYEYHDATRARKATSLELDALYSKLLREIRLDSFDHDPEDDADFSFKLINAGQFSNQRQS